MGNPPIEEVKKSNSIIKVMDWFVFRAGVRVVRFKIKDVFISL